jgi:hypothetical protein
MAELAQALTAVARLNLEQRTSERLDLGQDREEGQPRTAQPNPAASQHDLVQPSAQQQIQHRITPITPHNKPLNSAKLKARTQGSP